jgi:hypothetical protein
MRKYLPNLPLFNVLTWEVGQQPVDSRGHYSGTEKDSNDYQTEFLKIAQDKLRFNGMP